ncbi:MAG: integrase [Gammaproteobacteria bacterium]|nr:MAG: integrase [Gammaproteobacteria bacterium]
MARVTKPLNDTQIKNAKSRSKEYTLFDGGGLTLRIKPSGSKTWLFNYYKPFSKKRTNLSLGSYSDAASITGITLAKARALHTEYKDLLALDIDPREHLVSEKQKNTDAHLNTFKHIASQWREVKKTKVSERHATKVWQSLELHIIPEMGERPIHKVNAKDTIRIIRPIEKKGSLETVSRLCRRINEVMEYAVNSGVIDYNPLSKIYKAFGTPETKHMPTLKPEQLPDLMKAISRASIKLTTRCLIEWQLHTMVRPGEAAGTRWDEIDFKKELWSIPPERMKKKRGHTVPLSSQALALLDEMKPISGKREFVFPGFVNPRKPANPSTANMALKRMGYDGILTAHGQRSIASTALNEQGFDYDVIEVALAHVDKNNVRRAYNRAEYIEQRKKLMTWWSGFIDQAASSSISLAGSKKNLRIVNK